MFSLKQVLKNKIKFFCQAKNILKLVFPPGGKHPASLQNHCWKTTFFAEYLADHTGNGIELFSIIRNIFRVIQYGYQHIKRVGKNMFGIACCVGFPHVRKLIARTKQFMWDSRMWKEDWLCFEVECLHEKNAPRTKVTFCEGFPHVKNLLPGTICFMWNFRMSNEDWCKN